MVLARLNLVSRERLSAMKRRVGFVLLALALLVLGEWAGEDLVERPRLLLVLDSPVPLLGAAGLLVAWCVLGRQPPAARRSLVLRVRRVELSAAFSRLALRLPSDRRLRLHGPQVMLA